MNTTEFKEVIWKYYRENKRDLPWRRTRDPYKILVSEIMLQQTQVPRVIEKYDSFLKKFPKVSDVAEARLSEVLAEWQGLGYNRRALYLKRCCEEVVSNYKGKFPRSLEELCKLPGIGKATAGDLLAFAYNIPTTFIETNIRSVYIHFFFNDIEKISDKDILKLVEQTLDTENPREWISALFDYGAQLKKTSNPNKKSLHYKTQSKFVGSNRQKRSQILKLILKNPQTEKEIINILKLESKIVKEILKSLEKENMLKKVKDVYIIA